MLQLKEEIENLKHKHENRVLELNEAHEMELSDIKEIYQTYKAHVEEEIKINEAIRKNQAKKIDE